MLPNSRGFVILSNCTVEGGCKASSEAVQMFYMAPMRTLASRVYIK